MGQTTGRRIVIVQYSAARDGSAFSGLLLANGLRDAGWESHVLFGHDGPMRPEYAKRGHYTYVVPHKNWLRRAQPLRFLRDVAAEIHAASTFKALIADVHPKVVYINTVVSLAGALAARHLGIPCIWHLRELFADVGGEMHAPPFARPWLRMILYRCATKLVANSRAVADNVLGWAGAENISVVPNAAGSEFFDEKRTQAAARAALHVPEQGLILGVPGTLRPVKGHAFFFHGIAALVRQRPDLLIAVTGDGNNAYTEALRAQLKHSEIAGQVCFLGSIDDMAAFYRACDLVCIPSRAEPFGRTVIEAMACGTPVLATAVGGICEIVENTVNGLLVAYGDKEALAAALLRLLNSPTLRHRMTDAARKKAEREYHERIYQRRLVALVEDV